MTRLTKIQATLGPASSGPLIISRMLDAGMDGVRLNMSHGSHEMLGEIVRNVRRAAGERGVTVPIGADLRGPKLRIGEVEGGTVVLEDCAMVTVTPRPCLSTADRIWVDYPSLAEQVQPGGMILVHDGFISLQVEVVRDGDLVCRVFKGGPLSSRKGVNLPGVALRVPSLTEKDEADIAFAVGAGLDFLFVSYARSRRHIQEVRAAVKRLGASLPLVAKIERRDGVDSLSEIVEEAEGICIARGDLGIEVPISEVPSIQREAARLCQAAGRFVMNGGQLLAGMVSSPIPLRAEVSDLSVVVRDGLDAIVLSDETAAGDYPVEAVALAASVLEEAERYEAAMGTLRAGARLAAPVKGEV